MYNLLIALGFVAGLLYVILYAKKYDLNRIKAIIFMVLSYATVYPLIFILYYIVVGNFGGQNMVRVFVFFPLVIPFYAMALGINVRKALDFAAPIPLVIFGVTHIGCIWGGCCQTFIEVPWGIYNKFTKCTLFPNQILESIIAILTALLLMYLLQKNKYDMKGKAMGYMLIFYGVQRFILEFIRDNYKVFWGISELALWCVGAVIVGVILNYVILKDGKKELNP